MPAGVGEYTGGGDRRALISVSGFESDTSCAGRRCFRAGDIRPDLRIFVRVDKMAQPICEQYLKRRGPLYTMKYYSNNGDLISEKNLNFLDTAGTYEGHCISKKPSPFIHHVHLDCHGCAVHDYPSLRRLVTKASFYATILSHTPIEGSA